LQMSREPLELPKLIIKRDVDNIFDFKWDDFEFEGYESHDRIKGEVAV
jgi:thymidylate synthase